MASKVRRIELVRLAINMLLARERRLTGARCIPAEPQWIFHTLFAVDPDMAVGYGVPQQIGQAIDQLIARGDLLRDGLGKLHDLTGDAYREWVD